MYVSLASRVAWMGYLSLWDEWYNDIPSVFLRARSQSALLLCILTRAIVEVVVAVGIVRSTRLSEPNPRWAPTTTSSLEVVFSAQWGTRRKSWQRAMKQRTLQL